MSEYLSKILYVEDDCDIAEVAVMTLEDLGGFEVHHCDTGAKALQAFPDYQPQLVLLDVMMPYMDGKETYRLLRKLPGAERTPVIFMTAKAQSHEQTAYLAMGALGVVVKPFDPITLSANIRRIWECRDA